MLKSLWGLCFYAFLPSFLLLNDAHAEIPAEWEHPQSEIADAWRVRKEILAVGRDSVAKKELDRIKEIQQDHGLTSISSASLALLKEIQDHLDDSQDTQKIRLQYASQFSSDIPTPHYLYCQHVLSTGIIESFKECYRGLESELNTNSGQLLFYSNLVIFGLTSFSLLCFIFFTFILFRYRSSVSHHWAHWLKGISPLGIQLLTLVILFLSWITLGWMGPPLLIVALLWRYFNFSEQIVSVFIALITAVIPFTFYLPAYHLNYKRSILPILEDPLNGTTLVEDGMRLQEWLKKNPHDAEVLFTLGLMEKKLGRFEVARQYFEEAGKSKSGWSKPNINLATIDYLESKTESAISHLQPISSSFLASYNLAKIYYRLSKLDEGLQASRKAKELDPLRFADLEKGTSNQNDPKKILIDATLDEKDVYSRIWDKTPTIENLRNRFHQTWFSMLPLPFYWMILVMTFIYAILSTKFWSTRRVPRPCEKCGMPSCAYCEPMIEHESLCSQCYHIYVRLETIDPSARRHKENSIRIYRFLREFRERWMSLFLPGIHFLYREQTLRWFLMGIFLFPALVLMMFQSLWIPSIYAIDGLPVFPFHWVGAIIVTVVYTSLIFSVVKK